MCRTVTFVFLLAALAVYPLGAQTSVEKAHRKASTAHSAHRPEASKRAHRATPEEVGRAAGLKIRREMAERATSTRTSVRPSHSSVRYRHPRYASASRIRRARVVRASLHRTMHESTSEPAQAADFHEPAAEPVRSPSTGTEPEGNGPEENGMSSQSEPVAAEPSVSQEKASGSEAMEAAGTPKTGEDHASTESETTEDLTENRSTAPATETEEASLYIPRGAMPPPLRGSLESLERQNEKLTAEGLERIEDENDLSARIANGLLVPVPVSSSLTVNENLPPNHRYCRPWTARFLSDLAAAHDAVFHRPLEVSSAVRPETYQRRLMRTNGNAAPAEGDIVSPHMTGATIDIAKSGLTREEMGWMRQRLLALEAEGKIDVEEEFRQACFHITVYKTYAPAHAVRRTTPSRAQTPPAAPADPGTKTKSDETPVVSAQGV